MNDSLNKMVAKEMKRSGNKVLCRVVGVSRDKFTWRKATWSPMFNCYRVKTTGVEQGYNGAYFRVTETRGTTPQGTPMFETSY